MVSLLRNDKCLHFLQLKAFSQSISAGLRVGRWGGVQRAVFRMLKVLRVLRARRFTRNGGTYRTFYSSFTRLSICTFSMLCAMLKSENQVQMLTAITSSYRLSMVIGLFSHERGSSAASDSWILKDVRQGLAADKKLRTTKSQTFTSYNFAQYIFVELQMMAL